MVSARTGALLLLDANDPPTFPDPMQFDAQGLLAVGGDLSVERLLAAYRSGIFPWYNEGMPILWWSPDPRAVITAQSLHVSRSLHRELRRDDLSITWDKDFGQVLEGCASNRPGGTWLLPEMKRAYTTLHELGHAHSLEVWQQGRLVAGLYGVACGAVFAAESMFHTLSNASKVALVRAVRGLSACGVELVEVQFLTPHLHSLGALEVPRGEYLRRLAQLRDRQVTLDLAAVNC
jgi:leucyl/phenylalanyl-tRNA--protein transferase